MAVQGGPNTWEQSLKVTYESQALWQGEKDSKLFEPNGLIVFAAVRETFVIAIRDIKNAGSKMRQAFWRVLVNTRIGRTSERPSYY